MKYSLSNLLLAVVLLGVCFAWWSDRSRLTTERTALNHECIEMWDRFVGRTSEETLGRLVVDSGGTWRLVGPGRVYDYSKHADRIEWR